MATKGRTQADMATALAYSKFLEEQEGVYRSGTRLNSSHSAKSRMPSSA